jgi:hypothetical protein
MSIKPQPPGPKGQLLLGSLSDFQRDQLAFYSSCARVFLSARPRRCRCNTLRPFRALLI